MKQALLLIDIQNDYFPGGAMELHGSVEAGAKARSLLAAFRKNALEIVHIQHISIKSSAAFFLPRTDGACIHPCVAPLGGETAIQKHFPNSFRETPLLEHPRGRANDAGSPSAGVLPGLAPRNLRRRADRAGTIPAAEASPTISRAPRTSRE